jgi:excisionase family DNA binding protein
MSNTATHFLTLIEAAARVGLTKDTLREWVRRGRIASYKPGKRVLVRESDLIELVESSRKAPIGGAA